MFPLPRPADDHPHDALAAFLHARLAEEDTEAGGAWITHWRQPSSTALTVVDDHGEQVAQCKESGIARHMVRWNPLRVLDHVNACQILIDADENAPARSPERRASRSALCILTMPYADHPDWDPRWLSRAQALCKAHASSSSGSATRTRTSLIH